MTDQEFRTEVLDGLSLLRWLVTMTWVWVCLFGGMTCSHRDCKCPAPPVAAGKPAR
jgi:hypothetical protein